MHLADRLAYTTVVQYLNIIKLIHREQECPDPTTHFNVKCVLQGIKRCNQAQVVRKMPITPELLNQIYSCLDMTRIHDTAVWAAALVSFYGMFRRSNVTAQSTTSFDPRKCLTRGDVEIARDSVVIKIRWSKTIQFGERVLKVPLPRLFGQPLCPVAAVTHHFALTPGVPPSGPAFVSQTATNSFPLTATAFVKRVKECLETKGYNAREYAGHSFRRGGASYAHQQGIPLHTIKTIGDWRSDAYMAYVFDDFRSLKQQYKKLVLQ